MIQNVISSIRPCFRPLDHDRQSRVSLSSLMSKINNYLKKEKVVKDVTSGCVRAPKESHTYTYSCRATGTSSLSLVESIKQEKSLLVLSSEFRLAFVDCFFSGLDQQSNPKSGGIDETIINSRRY